MKRGRLLVVLFVLAAGGGLFAWKSSHGARDNTLLLADGSQVTFRAITLGQNHSYSYGNTFQRVAAWIPGRLGVKLSGNTLSKAMPSPLTNVVFWFLVRKNPSLRKYIHVTAEGSTNGLFRFNFKDDQGRALPGRSLLTLRPMPSGDVAVFAYSTNLPPASRTVHLWLQVWRDPPEEGQSREFVAPNPLYRKER